MTPTGGAGFDNVPQEPTGNASPPAHCHTGHSAAKTLLAFLQACQEAAGARAAWSPSLQSHPNDHAAGATLGRRRRPRRPEPRGRRRFFELPPRADARENFVGRKCEPGTAAARLYSQKRHLKRTPSSCFGINLNDTEDPSVTVFVRFLGVDSRPWHNRCSLPRRKEAVMTSSLFRIVLATLIVGVLAGASPAEAGGYVGLSVSNHGVSVGFGSSNWGIWGSSWNSGGASFGFSAALSGYGEWVRVDGLGRVWRPWVATGWQPYTHGRWVWTSLGWTWVAYEPWGWAPHHYGNWAYSTIGWVWSPGYVYHPGNVIWVSSGTHVGWYPCAPRGWSHYNRGYHHGWHSGYANGHRTGYSRGYTDGWRDARYATWVPRSRVTAENVAHHAVGHEAATRAVARSQIRTMSASPTRAQIERDAGRPVPEARIIERKTTIDGRDVRMVRPEGLERTVERHSASTVKRALNPAARDSVSRREARSVSSDSSRTTSRQQRSKATSQNVGSRRSTDHRRSSSPPSPATRSTTARSSSSAPFEERRQTRSATRSVTRSQTASPSAGATASTDLRRSARTRAPMTNAQVSSRSTPGSNPRTTSAVTSSRAKTEPTSARQRTAGKRSEEIDKRKTGRSRKSGEIGSGGKDRRRSAPKKD